MTSHLRALGSLWGLLVVLDACRGRAAPAPEPQSTTTPPRTDSPAASASQTASAASASPSSSTPQPASDGEPQPAHDDAGKAQAAPEVIARGLRVIVVDRGTVVARRPAGQATPLALARASREPEAKLSASVAPFLGRAELLDVTIVESSENGWHHRRRETHYVVDTSGANDALACVFEGSAQSGGEYASNSTTIGIKETARKPLAFDVARTTTSRAVQPRPSSETTKSVDHFELRASSCAALKP